MRSNRWFETEISRVEFVAQARACAHLLGHTRLMVLADPQQWPLHKTVATSPGRTSALAAAGSVLLWAPLAGRGHLRTSRSKRAVVPAALVEAGSEASPASPQCEGL